MSKIAAKNSITLAAGEAVQVLCPSDSQVEVSGTFGSLALTSSTGLAAARTADITAATFRSVMRDMLFTLTGGGPVVVTVLPDTPSANAALTMIKV